MKKNILAIICIIVAAATIYAKPRCHGFNNYDNKVTIILVDDKAGDKWMPLVMRIQVSYRQIKMLQNIV